MPTTVINVHSLPLTPSGRLVIPADFVYVGRRSRIVSSHGSKFANPFRMSRPADRQQVIGKYTEWLLQNPELIMAARIELSGKVLGCWCKPLSCHADILARIADGE